ncbi:MAG: RCC1 domain-containing protein, partial [Phycisphaerae bacterium]
MPFKLSAAFMSFMSFMSFLSCALLPTTALAGGTIAVFGDDSYLQITNAPTSRDDITQVAAGRRTGYALLENGIIMAWGSDTNGECQVPSAGAGHKFVQVRSGPNTGYGFTDDHRL